MIPNIALGGAIGKVWKGKRSLRRTFISIASTLPIKVKGNVVQQLQPYLILSGGQGVYLFPNAQILPWAI